MTKFNYDIEFSNGVTVTVLLTDQHPVTLWVKLSNGNRFEFSHEPSNTTKPRTVKPRKRDAVKSSKIGKRSNGTVGPFDVLTVTDTSSGSTAPLTMTYGDPEDPLM